MTRFLNLLALSLALFAASSTALPNSPVSPRTFEKKLDLAGAKRRFEDQLAIGTQQQADKLPKDYLSNVTDGSMWEKFQDEGVLPQPIRGKTGAAADLPSENIPVDRQNPDTFAPPSTDSGTIPQAKWPFALSHNRLQNGGWARQQNVNVLPVATEMAGVNMRLEEGAYRELHWHSVAEWAYILKGTFRVGAVDEEGRNDIGEVGPGDLWYFPSGIPHYIQSISKGGGEFLLVFDSGSFSEDATLMLTDFTAHIPREVLVKNFPTLSNGDFDKVPGSELYIFPSEAPAANDSQQVESPQGGVPNKFTHRFSEQKAMQLNGGTVKIVDSRNFPASKTIAAAEVTIEPGAMRELHWHPNSDEWDFFISGNARITIFAGQSNARTYDFQGGDVGYLRENTGHYIENIGNTTVRYLEIFKTDRYADVSLSNWLALTPPAVVKAHLGFSDEAMTKLEKFRTKNNQIVPGSSKSKRSLTEEAFVAGKRSWA